MKQKVVVVDNGGNSYFGTVVDVVKEPLGELYMSCNFGPVKGRVRKEGKVVEIEEDQNDGSVGIT